MLHYSSALEFITERYISVKVYYFFITGRTSSTLRMSSNDSPAYEAEHNDLELYLQVKGRNQKGKIETAKEKQSPTKDNANAKEKKQKTKKSKKGKNKFYE